MRLDEQALAVRHRGEAYWLLSHLFAKAPDEEVVARLRSGLEADMDDEFVAPLLAALDTTELASTVASRLAVEHTRLFRGVSEAYGPPPPHESLWREGVMMGESTVQVAQAYLDAGYEPQGDFNPCDHLVEELRFMGALCHAESEALLASLGDDAGAYRERQARFLDRHLNAWVPAYCRRLQDESKDPFYQALASVTASAVDRDKQFMWSNS